jgi:hypothetical protein
LFFQKKQLHCGTFGYKIVTGYRKKKEDKTDNKTPIKNLSSTYLPGLWPNDKHMKGT